MASLGGSGSGSPRALAAAASPRRLSWGWKGPRAWHVGEGGWLGPRRPHKGPSTEPRMAGQLREAEAQRLWDRVGQGHAIADVCSVCRVGGAWGSQRHGYQEEQGTGEPAWGRCCTRSRRGPRLQQGTPQKGRSTTAREDDGAWPRGLRPVQGLGGRVPRGNAAGSAPGRAEVSGARPSGGQWGAARAEPLPGRAGRVPGTLGAVPPALGVPWRAAHLTALPVWWEADADQVISATQHLKRTRSAPRESLPRDPAGAQERPPQAKRARSGNSQHNAGTGHRAPGWKPCRGLAASAVALLEASRSFSGSRHLPDESHTCSSVEECL